MWLQQQHSEEFLVVLLQLHIIDEATSTVPKSGQKVDYNPWGMKVLFLQWANMKHLSMEPNEVGCSHTSHDFLWLSKVHTNNYLYWHLSGVWNLSSQTTQLAQTNLVAKHSSMGEGSWHGLVQSPIWQVVTLPWCWMLLSQMTGLIVFCSNNG